MKLKSRLPEAKRKRQREASSSCWFTPQPAAEVGPGRNQSWELCVTRMQGTSAASQAHFLRTGFKVQQLGPESPPIWDVGVTVSGFSCNTMVQTLNRSLSRYNMLGLICRCFSVCLQSRRQCKHWLLVGMDGQ